MYVKIFYKEYPLPHLLLLTIAALILLTLGIWQLNRLDEKTKLISKISETITSPPLKLNPVDIFDTEKFSKVSAEGHFTNQHIFLYGRRSGTAEKDGYYVLTPFILDNQRIILVSRGWAPQSLKKKIENGEIQLPSLKEMINAIVMPGEHGQFLTPNNDVARNIWFNIDLELAKKIGIINFDQFYLRQIDNTNLPQGMVSLNADNLIHIRNDHLEYALTWFSLAISIVVIYFIYGGRANKVF
jgi:surfeit locus 1 family protein